MSIGAWLVRVFWRGVVRWIQRDPDARAARLEALLADLIEAAVNAAEEAAPTDPGPQP
jgi:hypothetical protein